MMATLRHRPLALNQPVAPKAPRAIAIAALVAVGLAGAVGAMRLIISLYPFN